MGHVAKSDGRVSEAEIDAARRVMRDFRLSPDQVAFAIDCFRRGKAPDYNAEQAIADLRTNCGPRQDLMYVFVELQLRAALIGNGLNAPARVILSRAAGSLGISEQQFTRFEAQLRAQYQAGTGGPGASQAVDIEAAYRELEVEASASNSAVTKAYRRQMSRHHPDKLVANGLPESMAEFAKEKTQRVQRAYETITAARGMR
jgi:DnaJ like chaperone protein